MTSNITRRSHFIAFAIIAIFMGSSALAKEAKTPMTAKPADPLPARQLYVNGFRSPSIGLEYRTGAFGFHSGYYTTILSKSDSEKNRSTQFLKTGMTYYFLGDARHEFFGSVAHVRGLSDGWKKDGAFFEVGSRWRLVKHLEFRLGMGVLTVPGRAARLNPTPGISFGIPL